VVTMRKSEALDAPEVLSLLDEPRRTTLIPPASPFNAGSVD
jgi:hypothetical protein